jgi:hypothetical protein
VAADVSLVTSCYRSSEWIEDYTKRVIALASAVHEAGVALEVVIVANDPEEAERAGISRLRDALLTAGTAAIQVLEVPRETLYASWNRGVGAAHGHAVGFWNVDDERSAEAVIAGSAVLSEEYDLVDFPFDEIRSTPSGEIVLRHEPHYVSGRLAPKFVIGTFFLARHTLIADSGGFDTRYHIAGDFDWGARVQKHARMIALPVPGGRFHTHGRNLSAARNPELWQEINAVLLKHGAFHQVRPTRYPRQMRAVWERLGDPTTVIPADTQALLWGRWAVVHYFWQTARRRFYNWRIGGRQES